MPQQTNAPSSSALVRLKLREISGLHPSIYALFAELGIPPLRFAPRLVRKDPHFGEYLKAGLLTVVRESRKVHVSANLRFYFAMRSVLDPSDEIQCIEHLDMDPQSIRTQAIHELIYLPAISGIHFSELNVITKAAARASEDKLWHPPTTAVETFIARLYGVDPRKLRKKHPPAADIPV
jgi:hypothetical protein